MHVELERNKGKLKVQGAIVCKKFLMQKFNNNNGLKSDSNICKCIK